jgi:hypothetical protein
MIRAQPTQSSVRSFIAYLSLALTAQRDRLFGMIDTCDTKSVGGRLAFA